MSTYSELKAGLDAIVVAAEDANVRLDAVNVKIDDLRAQIGAGVPVTQAQLDEAVVLVDAVRTSLAAVAVDITDAEQS